MSILSKQEWLETAEQFEILNFRIIDIQTMVDFWCGKKKKKVTSVLGKLYYLCDVKIRSLLEKVEFSQNFDKNDQIFKKYNYYDKDGYNIFNFTRLPDEFKSYRIRESLGQLKRPRPLLTHIPVEESSNYLNNLDQLHKLVHKVLGEGSSYRKLLDYDNIISFNEFNDLLQSCTKIIQDITYK